MQSNPSAIVVCVAMFVAACAFACSPAPSSSTVADGSRYDLSTDIQFIVPPGCPPAAGNERGVGKPCTRDGNECGTMHCTCNTAFGVVPPPSTPCFCTYVFFNGCPASPNCGTNASCCSLQDVESGGVAGCLPLVCTTDGVCPAILPSS